MFRRFSPAPAITPTERTWSSTQAVQGAGGVAAPERGRVHELDFALRHSAVHGMDHGLFGILPPTDQRHQLPPNGSGASVWMAGAGPATDANGNIYFLAANGTFDTTLNAAGFPNRGDYGNAFVKLSTAGSNLAVADYFNMSNTVAESNADQDLGSGGAVVLLDMTDSSGTIRHLGAGAGERPPYLCRGPRQPGQVQQRDQQHLAGCDFRRPGWLGFLLSGFLQQPASITAL